MGLVKNLAVAILSLLPLAVSQASNGAAYVDLSTPRGTATALAAGFLYGFPDNNYDAATAIPNYLVTEMGFRTNRAGGAQIDAGGWAYGEYTPRFESAFSNYQTTRKYGGDFILLLSDLWGAQGGYTDTTPFPGDNGNWTFMEEFLDQVISDMISYGMIDDVAVDLWNEPDGNETFWPRPWEQYLEYWARAYAIFKAQLPQVLVTGPAMANAPAVDNDNWNTWMAYVADNNVVPDRYSWHQIGTWEREPDLTVYDFDTMRATYDLPENPIDMNEYAWPSEQNPANSAWYISQLERHDVRGLRANWGGGPDLHNWEASLLYATNSGTGTYYPNGEWQVYKYYAAMSGDTRATTIASPDFQFDVFATTGDIVRILAGTRTVQEPYDIQIVGLTSRGLPDSGTISVRTYRFDWSGPMGEIGDPVDLGLEDYSFSDDTFTIHLNPATNSTAYAYEF